MTMKEVKVDITTEKITAKPRRLKVKHSYSTLKPLPPKYINRWAKRLGKETQTDKSARQHKELLSFLIVDNISKDIKTETNIEVKKLFIPKDGDLLKELGYGKKEA